VVFQKDVAAYLLDFLLDTVNTANVNIVSDVTVGVTVAIDEYCCDYCNYLPYTSPHSFYEFQ